MPLRIERDKAVGDEIENFLWNSTIQLWRTIFSWCFLSWWSIFIAVILNKSKQYHFYLILYCCSQQHCMMWSMYDLPVKAEKARISYYPNLCSGKWPQRASPIRNTKVFSRWFQDKRKETKQDSRAEFISHLVFLDMRWWPPGCSQPFL